MNDHDEHPCPTCGRPGIPELLTPKEAEWLSWTRRELVELIREIEGDDPPATEPEAGEKRGHFLWRRSDRVAFCGKPIPPGHPAFPLDEATGPLCPACEAIYQAWQRSGAWEGPAR